MEKPQVAAVVQHADYPKHWRTFEGPTGVWVLGYVSEPARSVQQPDVISVVDSDDGASVKIHISAERADFADAETILGILSHDVLDGLNNLTQGWRLVSASLPIPTEEDDTHD